MKNKGITMAALIITIVVIILIAVVTISIMSGDEIIKYAEDSKEVNEIATIKEEILLAANSVIIEHLGVKKAFYDRNSDEITSNLDKYLEAECTAIKAQIEKDENLLISYKGYVWKLKLTDLTIEKYSEINANITADGTVLDGIEVQDAIENAQKAKNQISAKPTTDSGYQGVVSTDNKINADIEPTNEIVFYSEDYNGNKDMAEDKKNLLAVSTYCNDNVMIYDGSTTSLYVPVMVKFYRVKKNTAWPSQKNRGLKYVSVDVSNMSFSTYDSNIWNFIEDDENYNYESTSDRKCSSDKSGNPSFSDVEHGHWYASGRLTYTQEPIALLTDLGSFKVEFADQDGNEFALGAGSNYVVDIREYNATLKKAQDLIKNTENVSETANELYELSKVVLLATSKEYTYSEADVFAFEINDMTVKLKEKINALEEAIQNMKEISNEVLGTIKTAKNIEIKVEAQPTTDSGYQGVVSSNNKINADIEATNEVVFYSEDYNPEFDGDDGDKILLAISTYCYDNVMIYDGTFTPYVPVMTKFYRVNKKTTWPNKKNRGLRYVSVDTSNMSFSTCDNNNWNFVEDDENYNYEAITDRKCSSDKSANPSFSDVEHGHWYASGRLTYTKEPTELLTDLGPFKVVVADQDGNQIPLSTGSNYVIDLRGYYKKIEEAKEVLTNENMYKDVDALYELSKVIIQASKTEFTYNDAKVFANEIETLMQKLTEGIENCKK